MAKLLLILFLIFNFREAIATEVELPNNLGKINILNNVITIPEGMNIPDGNYAVVIDGNQVIVHFENNNGIVK